MRVKLASSYFVLKTIGPIKTESEFEPRLFLLSNFSFRKRVVMNIERWQKELFSSNFYESYDSLKMLLCQELFVQTLMAR